MVSPVFHPYSPLSLTYDRVVTLPTSPTPTSCPPPHICSQKESVARERQDRPLQAHQLMGLKKYR